MTDARAVFTRLTVAENLRVFRTTAAPSALPRAGAPSPPARGAPLGGQQQMLALGLAISASWPSSRG